MDGSKGQPHMTAGLDLGDKYSHLCLIDTQSGEVMERKRAVVAVARKLSVLLHRLWVSGEDGSHPVHRATEKQ
jgi:hypothetical protein